MNYTENYHLPQWVETDRVQMEDFNAAMVKIDQTLGLCLTPEGVPSQYGTFYFNGSTAAGAAMATFTFPPRFVILEFYKQTYILPQGGSISVQFGSGNYSVQFLLSGSTLKLSQKDEDISAGYSGKFVAWP